jgi:hypothetical protein
MGGIHFPAAVPGGLSLARLFLWMRVGPLAENRPDLGPRHNSNGRGPVEAIPRTN